MVKMFRYGTLNELRQYAVLRSSESQNTKSLK
jgi:hypothetical protein